MKTIRTRSFWLALTAGLWLGAANPAHALCNDPKNWLAAPGPSIKMIVGKEQEQPLGFADVNARVAYPAPMPKDLLDKVTGALPADGGDISYYEEDGRGNWRICRVDKWNPNRYLNGSPEDTAAQRLSKQYVASSSRLAKLVDGYWIYSAKQYFYDAKGRIERVMEWHFIYGKPSPEPTYCFRFDDKDRIIQSVSPKTTKICPRGEPDLRDSWSIYRYGEYEGKTVTLLDRGHSGNSDGTWSEGWTFHAGPAPEDTYGVSKANSKKGVKIIYGSSYGKLDDNPANKVVDSFGSWNGSTYVFTKPPVPLAVIENPELIYQYERRRQTYVDGNFIRLFELFKANENIARHRYYTLDGSILRHEQLDAKGRITRVITINDWRQPRPGPNPQVNDKLLTNKGIRVFAHQIYHRVYDLDANGKPTLVAISWNRARRLNPLKKTHIDLADLVYGTPNGKERWKTRDEFEKAFDTSWQAAQVYPDMVGKTGDEDED